MSDPKLHGRFVWHELMTTDPKSAGRFFSGIIGWKTQPWPNDPSYTLFMNGKQSVAGLMLLPEPAKAMGVPPSWVTYIGTPDLAGTIAKAQGLGARMLREPETLPSVGTFAVLQDPQGAAFSIFTPETDTSSDAPASVGEFSWHELATTDYKAALSFYQQLFGWENAGGMDMGEGLGMYQMFGRGGRPLGGIFNKPASMPGPAFWLPYIQVKDARQVAAAVSKAKARVINGPVQVPGGDWIAQGMDLQGAVFAVHSLKDGAAATVPPAAAKPASKAPAKKAAPKKAAPKKAAAARSTRKSAGGRKTARPRTKAAAGRKKGGSPKKKGGSPTKKGGSPKKKAGSAKKKAARRMAGRRKGAAKRSRR